MEVLRFFLLVLLLNGVDPLEILGDGGSHLLLVDDGHVLVSQDGAYDGVVGLHAQHLLDGSVERLPVVVAVVLFEFVKELVLVEDAADDQILRLVNGLPGLVVFQVDSSCLCLRCCPCECLREL